MENDKKTLELVKAELGMNPKDIAIVAREVKEIKDLAERQKSRHKIQRRRHEAKKFKWTLV